MALNERELSALQTVLLGGVNKRNKNKTLLALVERYGIGQVVGDKIIYSESCFDAMRNLYHRYAKVSEYVPRTGKMDRIEKSKISVNEKSGSGAVFGSLLQVAAYRRSIPVVNGMRLNVNEVEGVGVLLKPQHIDFSRITKIVIVENGIMLSVLYLWHHLMPIRWQDALFVYRGHEANRVTLNEMLATMPANIEIGIYTDFDLGGLAIIAGFGRIRPVAFFVPEQWEIFERTGQHNNESVFERQISTLKAHYPYKNLNLLAQYIVKNRIAIMQENFEALGPLKEMSLP